MKQKRVKAFYPKHLKQLENPQNDVVHIAKPRGFTLLRMVKPTAPINRNIRILPVQLNRSANRTSGGSAAEVEKPVEDGTILADVESPQVPRGGVIAHGLRRDGAEEIDVVRGMELADVGGVGEVRAADLEATVEVVVYDEAVSHTDPVRLHRVSLAVVVVADRRLVEVADSTLASVGT